MPATAEEYLRLAGHVCEEAAREERAHIEEAARAIASSLESGGNWWLFGTGHSHIMVEELWGRAGGLTQIRAILEPAMMLHEGLNKSTKMERLPGVSNVIAPHDQWKKGDVILIASNSGRNAAPVEMAQLAADAGLTVVALTSRTHSNAVDSRAPAGLKLKDVADIVIDNHGVHGDAIVPREGALPVGATSTAVGALLLQALAVEVVGIMDRDGQSPDVYLSANA